MTLSLWALSLWAKTELYGKPIKSTLVQKMLYLPCNANTIVNATLSDLLLIILIVYVK